MFGFKFTEYTSKAFLFMKKNKLYNYKKAHFKNIPVLGKSRFLRENLRILLHKINLQFHIPSSSTFREIKNVFSE